jgi:hypothetical protein
MPQPHGSTSRLQDQPAKRTQVSRAKEGGMFGNSDVAIKTARTDGNDRSDNAVLQSALVSEARILDRLQAAFCERVLRPVGLQHTLTRPNWRASSPSGVTVAASSDGCPHAASPTCALSAHACL